MPNDNPYKIRADLLGLARDILSENLHIKLDFAHEHSKKLTPSGPPKGYTVEEVIAEAEKLYAFVSRK